MVIKNLEVYYPSYITLQGGKRVHLSKKDILDEEYFSLLVPTKVIDEIATKLKNEEGFKDAFPAFDKGEDYSVSKVLLNPWELHIRLYHDSIQNQFGKIQAHIEVSREYLEHFHLVQPVIYEPFEFYRKVFSEFVVWCNPYGNWVSSIDENYKITLQGPNSLTPWKPIVVTVAAVGIFAGILYAIDKLSKPKKD